MNLPPLPELPEPDGSAAVVVGTVPSGPMMADVEKYADAWSREKVEAYALAYGRAVQQAERERAIRLCREQQSIYEYKMKQAMDSDREERWDRFYNYHDAVENIVGWIEGGQENIPAAAAIRNGVIREGEGE